MLQRWDCLQILYHFNFYTILISARPSLELLNFLPVKTNCLGCFPVTPFLSPLATLPPPHKFSENNCTQTSGFFLKLARLCIWFISSTTNPSLNLMFYRYFLSAQHVGITPSTWTQTTFFCVVFWIMSLSGKWDKQNVV